MAQTIKNLPAMQETQVQSLGWEDSTRDRNGNPLQYSCLENPMGKKRKKKKKENPMGRGAWQATVHRVAVRHNWSDLAYMHTNTHTHTKVCNI